MIYLFYGSDEFSRSEAIMSLRSQIPPDVLNLNYSRLEGRKLKIPDLAVACEALPFLADMRLVVLNDALKHTKASADREALRNYLDRVPDTCTLVFMETEDFDKRSGVFTYLKKHAQIREFAPPQGAEMQRWLVERAATFDSHLEHQAAQRLVEYIGSDTRMLVTEIEKLATYVGRGGRIKPGMVDLMVEDRHEQNLFAFIDSLSTRRQAQALEGIHRLIKDGQAPTYILFMLARQVRILLGVRELTDQRRSAGDIASTLKQKPFVVKKAMDQVRNFATGELETLHDQILALDHATKTGRVSAEVALDVLVMDVCRRKT